MGMVRQACKRTRAPAQTHDHLGVLHDCSIPLVPDTLFSMTNNAMFPQIIPWMSKLTAKHLIFGFLNWLCHLWCLHAWLPQLSEIAFGNCAHTGLDVKCGSRVSYLNCSPILMCQNTAIYRLWCPYSIMFTISPWEKHPEQSSMR